MKPLKSIVEGILDDIDKDIEDATIASTFSDHDGWGNDDIKYRLVKDTLYIDAGNMPWQCKDDEFWNIVKKLNIKHIVCDSSMGFADINVNISGITFDVAKYLTWARCDVALKNCYITCGTWVAYDGGLKLDGTDIVCTTPKSGADFLRLHPFECKRSHIKCHRIIMRYDKSNGSKLKGTDWGNYIESLGTIKLTASDGVRMLKSYAESNDDFIPVWGEADKYNIYTGPGPKQHRITFEKMDQKRFDGIWADSKIHFKNDWGGLYVK